MKTTPNLIKGGNALFKMTTPLFVGITGSVGSGKSLLTKFFVEKDWNPIDADDLGREVIDSNPEILEKLVRSFGTDIVDEEGHLRRRFLRIRAFTSRDGVKKLNEAVHPPLIQLLKQRIMEERHRVPGSRVVVDCALIFEWCIEDLFDAVITVWADERIRRERFLTRDDVSTAVFDGIEQAQLPQSEKLKRATYSLENNGNLPTFQKAAEKLYGKIILSQPEASSN